MDGGDEKQSVKSARRSCEGANSQKAGEEVERMWNGANRKEREVENGDSGVEAMWKRADVGQIEERTERSERNERGKIEW